MPPLKRPSYIPKPASIIPPGLAAEEQYWSFHPELVLTQSSTEKLLKSHKLMEELFQNGFLKEMGLNPNARGAESLKGHGTRVAIFSLLINEELRRKKSTIVADTRILASAAILHDIGKLDPEILSVVMYPGIIAQNDAVAWTLIKRHPTVGHVVSTSMPKLCEDERIKVAKSIYSHHERQDGKGYHRTHLSNIPPEAQIITAADTMDVMLGKRPYKEPSTTDEVIAELERCKGQFNQEVANAAKNIRPPSGDFVYYKSA